MKGYLLVSIVSANINGTLRGLGKDEVVEMVAKAAEEAQEICSPIFEKMVVAGDQGEGLPGELDQHNLDVPFEVMEDWDFMVCSEYLHMQVLGTNMLPDVRCTVWFWGCGANESDGE